MKSFFIIFIVFGFLIPHAFCQTAALFGVGTIVNANTQYQFSFGNNLVLLDIMVDAETAITLSPYGYSNLAAYPLPIDFQGVIYDDSYYGDLVGWQLTFNTNTKIVNTATLVIPVDNSMVNLNYNLAILQWDSTVLAYTFLTIITTQLDATFTFTDPGIFLVVQYNPASPVTFPSIFSQILTISSNTTSYSFPNGVFIDVSSSTNGLVFNVVFLYLNPEPNSPPNHTSAEKFLDITLLPTANIVANISFTYSYNYNPAKLAIAFFNTTSGSWNFPTTGLSVNTQTQIISQTATHFSTWGLFYASSAPTVTVTWATIIFVCALLLS
jgi:hypothetical protein